MSLGNVSELNTHHEIFKLMAQCVTFLGIYWYEMG